MTRNTKARDKRVTLKHVIKSNTKISKTLKRITQTRNTKTRYKHATLK